MRKKSAAIIGVLDIQGSVAEHLAMLRRLKVPAVAVKTKEDLANICGLIIPGGESTTIGKLLKLYGLDVEIRRRAREGSLAVWGTCAGAILLAKKIIGPRPNSLELMDIEIERNAYGHQMESFETEIDVPKLGKKKIPAVFIRAPRVSTIKPSVQVLAQLKGSPIMLQQGNLLATMFHPELTNDTRVHHYFIHLAETLCKAS